MGAHHWNLDFVTWVPEKGHQCPFGWQKWMRYWHLSWCFSWLYPDQSLAKLTSLLSAVIGFTHSHYMGRTGSLFLVPQRAKRLQPPLEGKVGQVELLLPSQRWRPPFRTRSLQKLPYQKNNKGVCTWRNHFGKVTTAESGHILQHSNGKVSQEEPGGGLLS